MSDNPFQSPQQDNPYGHPPVKQQRVGRTYIQQINVVASFFIAQGVLLLLYAVLLFVLAFFATNLVSFMPPDQRAQMQDQMQQQTAILSIVYGTLSAVIFCLAVMHFMAAYFGFKLKYRVFGIITMIMGLGSMLTCYCAPTAIGLAVYGMIIYFNPAVAQAFELAKSGMRKDQILEQFPH